MDAAGVRLVPGRLDRWAGTARPIRVGRGRAGAGGRAVCGIAYPGFMSHWEVVFRSRVTMRGMPACLASSDALLDPSNPAALLAPQATDPDAPAFSSFSASSSSSASSPSAVSALEERALSLASGLELTLRSLNHLVERVHHSSFLYLLAGLDRWGGGAGWGGACSRRGASGQGLGGGMPAGGGVNGSA